MVIISVGSLVAVDCGDNSSVLRVHHREGKTNDITGRFFRPRVSEEFYDNQNDFDNVHNLINDEQHQQKIAELKKAQASLVEDLKREVEKNSAFMVFEAEAMPVKTFAMIRHADESGVSGTGRVLDGVVWHNGATTIMWRTDVEAGAHGY